MKRLADRRQRRLRRAGFWIAVAAIGGYLFFVGDQRPHHLLMLWLEERRAEERIAALEAERAELATEARRLESDSLALEALAREKGMVRPGDLVYRIVPVPPDVREAAAESLAARAARLAADSLAAARETEARRAATSRPTPSTPYPEGGRPAPASVPRDPSEREPGTRPDPTPSGPAPDGTPTRDEAPEAAGRIPDAGSPVDEIPPG